MARGKFKSNLPSEASLVAIKQHLQAQQQAKKLTLDHAYFDFIGDTLSKVSNGTLLVIDLQELSSILSIIHNDKNNSKLYQAAAMYSSYPQGLCSIFNTALNQVLKPAKVPGYVSGLCSILEAFASLAEYTASRPSVSQGGKPKNVSGRGQLGNIIVPLLIKALTLNTNVFAPVINQAAKVLYDYCGLKKNALLFVQSPLMKDNFVGKVIDTCGDVAVQLDILAAVYIGLQGALASPDGAQKVVVKTVFDNDLKDLIKKSDVDWEARLRELVSERNRQLANKASVVTVQANSIEVAGSRHLSTAGNWVDFGLTHLSLSLSFPDDSSNAPIERIVAFPYGDLFTGETARDKNDTVRTSFCVKTLPSALEEYCQQNPGAQSKEGSHMLVMEFCAEEYQRLGCLSAPVRNALEAAGFKAANQRYEDFSQRPAAGKVTHMAVMPGGKLALQKSANASKPTTAAVRGGQRPPPVSATKAMSAGNAMSAKRKDINDKLDEAEKDAGLDSDLTLDDDLVVSPKKQQTTTFGRKTEAPSKSKTKAATTAAQKKAAAASKPTAATQAKRSTLGKLTTAKKAPAAATTKPKKQQKPENNSDDDDEDDVDEKLPEKQQTKKKQARRQPSRRAKAAAPVQHAVANDSGTDTEDEEEQQEGLTDEYVPTGLEAAAAPKQGAATKKQPVAVKKKAAVKPLVSHSEEENDDNGNDVVVEDPDWMQARDKGNTATTKGGAPASTALRNVLVSDSDDDASSSEDDDDGEYAKKQKKNPPPGVAAKEAPTALPSENLPLTQVPLASSELRDIAKKAAVVVGRLDPIPEEDSQDDEMRNSTDDYMEALPGAHKAAAATKKKLAAGVGTKHAAGQKKEQPAAEQPPKKPRGRPPAKKDTAPDATKPAPPSSAARKLGVASTDLKHKPPTTKALGGKAATAAVELTPLNNNAKKAPGSPKSGAALKGRMAPMLQLKGRSNANKPAAATAAKAPPPPPLDNAALPPPAGATKPANKLTVPRATAAKSKLATNISTVPLPLPGSRSKEQQPNRKVVLPPPSSALLQALNQGDNAAEEEDVIQGLFNQNNDHGADHYHQQAEREVMMGLEEFDEGLDAAATKAATRRGAGGVKKSAGVGKKAQTGAKSRQTKAVVGAVNNNKGGKRKAAVDSEDEDDEDNGGGLTFGLMLQQALNARKDLEESEDELDSDDDEGDDRMDQYNQIKALLQQAQQAKQRQAEKKVQAISNEVRRKVTALTSAAKEEAEREEERMRSMLEKKIQGFTTALEDKVQEMEEATETYNSKIQAMWDEYNNLFEQAEKVALAAEEEAKALARGRKRKYDEVMASVQETVSAGQKKINRVSKKANNMPEMASMLLPLLGL